MNINKETLNRIYAGLIGMVAGMRLGAPLESPHWDYDKIRDYYGDITGYLRTYKHFAADDDVNGPLIFIRALTDGGLHEDLTPDMAAEAWLNYTRYMKGMFWWGGEDMATEHRAFMNLRRGVKAPECGSIALNGKTAAEQIGGQIFVDTWGLVCPGDSERAAKYARAAASVSHDGSGLDGAAFMAAAVAAAFTCGTVDEIIDKALEYIPENCDYRTVVNAVRDFHKKNPDDFRAARAFVDENFGAHLFPGYCHIIPNAGICILAMLYSGGDLGRAIEIAVMCGFDTDCNSSSIGTVLGVWNGIEKVPERYRKPINDTVVLSSASGYLNMQDLPEAAKNIYNTACELYGAESEKVTVAKPGEIFMDFSLPGSTYGIELSEEAHHTIRNSEGCGENGGNALELLIDGKHPKPVNMTFKAFYTADDFNDDQYSPVFSPRVYPGQTVEASVYVQPESEAAVSLKPLLNTVFNKTEYCGDMTELSAGKWQKIEFKVPSLSGDIIHDIGFEVAVKALVPEPQVKVHVYFDYIRVSGGYGCLFDLTRGIKEFDEPIPFSTTDCKTFFTRGMLYMTSEELGLAFTGNYYAADQSIEAVTDIDSGSTAGFILRAQGLRRFYSLGLDKGRAVIKLHFNGEVTELASADTALSAPNCNMIARAEGDKLSLYINGEAIVQAADNTLTYGMVGMFTEKSQAGFENIAIIGKI